MVNASHIRSSKEMNMLINNIQIEFLKKGKKVPSVRNITKMIAKKIRKEDILFHEFIPFK